MGLKQFIESKIENEESHFVHEFKKFSNGILGFALTRPTSRLAQAMLCRID